MSDTTRAPKYNDENLTDHADKYLLKAKKLVANDLRSHGLNISETQVYVVWFAKVLNNWKALVSTDLYPGIYYEVTYDGLRRRTYVDGYTKTGQIVVDDID